MTTTPYDLVDRLLAPDSLPAFLCRARSEGESYEAIARRLASEHDITVTSETVRRWCARAEAESAPEPEVAAS